MAFSDWSEDLRKKREMIGHHTFPKIASSFFANFNSVASKEMVNMMETLKSTISQKQDQCVSLKPLFLDSTFKIFMKYFCNLEINADNAKEAQEVIQAFDDVFQEVNQSCVADLFPVLMPICGKSHLPQFGHVIREFTMKHCVEPRLRESKSDDNNNEKPAVPVTDLLGEFMANVEKSEDMTLHGALFALEDIFGGHSAISNFLTTVVVFLARNPVAQAKVREEVSGVFGSDPISLDRKLPYCESVIWESARSLSSPLVPHVANQDTVLGGKLNFALLVKVCLGHPFRPNTLHNKT
jgi:cytochrome P450 family 307 subfamily A